MSEWMAWAIIGGLVVLGAICIWWTSRSRGSSGPSDHRRKGHSIDTHVEIARAQAINQDQNGMGMSGF
jgi:hypothetical protein